jgi:FkbM family methyltransferase
MSNGLERVTHLLPGELRVIYRLPLLNPKLLIDVGSAFGEYTDSMRDVCPEAKIFSYDPQAGTPAIGAEDGELNMVLFPSVPDRSSGVKVYTDMITGGPRVERVVPLKRLDTLHPDVEIDFLKIDVEGMEWDVLEGLGKLRPKLVQFEHGWADRYAGHGVSQFMDFFRSWNYVTRELDFENFGDAEDTYYNYLAGPSELVRKFF